MIVVQISCPSLKKSICMKKFYFILQQCMYGHDLEKLKRSCSFIDHSLTTNEKRAKRVSDERPLL